MSKIKSLDWLATEVITMFENLDFPPAYVESKKYDLGGKTRMQVLQNFSNLDSRCLSALAVQLDVPLDDLQTTLRVVSKL